MLKLRIEHMGKRCQRKYRCVWIRSADTVEDMIQYRIGRCHPLLNNRKGQYAVDLVHPFRLVFKKHGDTA